MVERDGEEVGAALAVLLWLSREASDLAWMIERMLSEQELLALMRQRGMSPRQGHSLAQQCPTLLAQNERFAEILARGLLASAPEGPAPEWDSTNSESLEPNLVTAEDWRRILRDALRSGSEAGAARIRAARLAANTLLPPRESPPAASTPRVTKPRAPRKSGKIDPELEIGRLKGECARLQSELAAEHERKRECVVELESARSELRSERQRASEMKKRLAATVDPQERERTLRELADRLQHELSVLRQKFELLEEERDDLRACLEDYDRFFALPEEDIPSFRNRPLLPEEIDLKHALAASGRNFRLLVVGGGEPQHRHHGKLEEYAEAMGFSAEWRMAEYVSWHREIDKLAADMKGRFDALVILHYNRTTFTRHARTICDAAGHKPCLTCRYEGFTSLRGSLRECLRQLQVARRA